MAKEIKFGTYDFEDSAEEWDTRLYSKVSERERALVDGTFAREAEVDSRIVDLQGTLIGSSESALQTKLDELATALHEGKQRLTLFDDWYLTAQKRSFTYEYGVALLTLNYRISFLAEDPYFYSISDSEDLELLDESPHEYTISNNGDAPVYPTITVKNSGDYSALTIENETDERKFVYEDLAFRSGDTVVFDCAAGTVVRNSTNTIRFFSGLFLRLLSGSNTIELTGITDGSVEFDWTDRKL